jgi:hypothetical protein
VFARPWLVNCILEWPPNMTHLICLIIRVAMWYESSLHCFLCFWDRTLVYSLGCHWTHHVAQAPETSDPPTSASWVLWGQSSVFIQILVNLQFVWDTQFYTVFDVFGWYWALNLCSHLPGKYYTTWIRSPALHTGIHWFFQFELFPWLTSMILWHAWKCSQKVMEHIVLLLQDIYHCGYVQ